jgi:hypothetical protein
VAAFDAEDANVRDQVRHTVGGRGYRQDPALGAVDDEDAHIDLGEIVAEVGEPGQRTRG